MAPRWLPLISAIQRATRARSPFAFLSRSWYSSDAVSCAGRAGRRPAPACTGANSHVHGVSSMTAASMLVRHVSQGSRRWLGEGSNVGGVCWGSGWGGRQSVRLDSRSVYGDERGDSTYPIVKRHGGAGSGVPRPAARPGLRGRRLHHLMATWGCKLILSHHLTLSLSCLNLIGAKHIGHLQLWSITACFTRPLDTASTRYRVLMALLPITDKEIILQCRTDYTEASASGASAAHAECLRRGPLSSVLPLYPCAWACLSRTWLLC